MKLSILYKDGRIEEITIKRASNISSKTLVQYLYYEKPGDLRGKGKTVHMADIDCWEIIKED